MTPKVLPGNTSKYLSQMKSDLHENFSECKYQSPGLIKNACGRARPHTAHVNIHATYNQSYLQSMKLNLYENWYFYDLGIKDTPKKI